MVKLVLPDPLKPQSPADLPPPVEGGAKPTAIVLKPDPKKLKRLIIAGFSILILAVAIAAIWYLQLHGYIGVKTQSVSSSPSAQASSSNQVVIPGFLPQVSPTFTTSSKMDKGRIVFVRNGNLWVIDTNGQKQLTTYPTDKIVLLPRLSPDNSKIVYTLQVNTTTSSTEEAHVINYDGTSDRRLAAVSLPNLDWANAGDALMTIATPPTIRIIDLNGREIKKVNAPVYSSGCGGAAGGDIALGILWEIFTGTGLRQVNYWLDGNHYLYPSGTCGASLYQIADDSGTNHKLAEDLYNPRASLDYTQFVGTNAPNQGKSIYYYKADGTLIKKINLDNIALNPILSVDNRFIFFTTTVYQNSSDQYSQATSSLWKVNNDGTGVTKVFDDVGSYQIIPEMFSGDGNLLIYERVNDDNLLATDQKNHVTNQTQLANDTPRSDIYLWNSTSGDRTKIVENGYQAVYSSK